MRKDTEQAIDRFHLSFSARQIKTIEAAESSLSREETVLYLDFANLSVVTARHKRIQISPDSLFLLSDKRIFLQQPGVFKPITENIPLREIQSVESREDAENAGHLLFTASGRSYDVLIAKSREEREIIRQELDNAIRTCAVSEDHPPKANPAGKISSTEETPSAKNKPKNYRYFSHKECEYFPCHKDADPDDFNCLFCYCPFYLLGDQCGGNFRYLSTGTKDCTDCLYPHLRENYDEITARYQEIREAMPDPGQNFPG